MSATIHPTAFVAPTAKLADGVVVGRCALIGEHVEIGEGCRIEAFASVQDYTRLGKNNVIHSYALVGGIPQDLKFNGEVTSLEMGDGNTVREFTALHRGTEGGGGVTRIGSNNLIMAYVHIAHDCQVGSGVVMSNNATLAGHVTVEDGAILGGLSAVHQFCRVGRNAFLGGMSGTAYDVPPYMMAVGVRGGLQGPNLVGLRRMGLPRDTISAIRAVYQQVWLGGLPKEEALALAEREYGSIPQVMEIVNFVRSSTRGVLPASRNGEDRA